jgi:hypothetical protein
MPNGVRGNNTLHELAQAMAAGGRHSTAAALRKLAYEGYATLEQVDRVSDWVLLTVRGIGMGRLGEVRRLTRSDWQPPSPQAIQAGKWFLSAAQFALRYWPLDSLTSLIRGSAPTKVNGRPFEKQLALDAFSRATCRALTYCPSHELIRILELTRTGHHPSCAPQDPGLFHSREVQIEEIPNEQHGESCTDTPRAEASQDDILAESDRYAYSPRKRREIVEHYRAVRDRGLIEHKDHWAQSNYNITGRTLLNYEREFPEGEQRIP